VAQRYGDLGRGPRFFQQATALREEAYDTAQTRSEAVARNQCGQSFTATNSAKIQGYCEGYGVWISAEDEPHQYSCKPLMKNRNVHIEGLDRRRSKPQNYLFPEF
jgi:hypothetical protein